MAGVTASDWIGVNDRGCVSIGSTILGVPEGSRLDSEESAIQIPGLDAIDFGERITIGGVHRVYQRGEGSEELWSCVSSDTTSMDVFIVVGE